jgi:hypothetical protein
LGEQRKHEELLGEYGRDANPVFILEVNRFQSVTKAFYAFAPYN